MTDPLEMNEDVVKQRTTEIIAQLNDEFRQTIIGKSSHHGGRIVLTQGVQAMMEEHSGEIIKSVGNYNNFNEDSDPYGEHDFGAFTIDGKKLFWKIDYYDENLEGLSPEPASEKLTNRVLTIMLASEY